MTKAITGDMQSLTIGFLVFMNQAPLVFCFGWHAELTGGFLLPSEISSLALKPKMISFTFMPNMEGAQALMLSHLQYECWVFSRRAHHPKK